MKLSTETLIVLKNFAAINPNLTVKTGNVLRTLSSSKNIFCEATVAETFSTEFGIWQLNDFLSAISLFKDPDFSFNENNVTISGTTGSRVTYFYSDPAVLTPVPTKFKMPEVKYKFSLSKDDITQLQKAAGVLKVEDISLESDGSKVYLKVHDKKINTSNDFRLDVHNTTTDSFSMHFKVENLKLLPGDYNISVSDKKIAEFDCPSRNIKYWISLEADSKWN